MSRKNKKDAVFFHPLVEFLQRIPAVKKDVPIYYWRHQDGLWSVTLRIDTRHPRAWHAVQELAYVLNGLSVAEVLPASFMPMSPPPYLNGGPRESLSWQIESRSADFTPNDVKEWLESRLPNPVDDIEQWLDDPPEDEDHIDECDHDASDESPAQPLT